MKPRLFIGSSVESLNTARAIQDNLEYDCHPTIWNQGVFNLNQSALESLLNALENFDFAVFVFEPNDVTVMRNDRINTVRDNVIFEFGLFIGKLGRDRVFFVTPRNAQELHLPTDLLGIVAGSYDAQHSNIQAAVGTFCNQVRGKLQEFIYQNLDVLTGEPQEIKKIVVERHDFWEYKFAASLLKNRFIEIDRIYYELDNGLFVKRTRHMDLQEFGRWFQEFMGDFINMTNISNQILNVELIKAFGAAGIPGDAAAIKYCIDKLREMSLNLLEWEKEIRVISPPSEIEEAKEVMKNWSRYLIDEVRKFYEIIDDFFYNYTPTDEQQILRVSLTLEPPPNMEQVLEIFKRALGLDHDEFGDFGY